MVADLKHAQSESKPLHLQIKFTEKFILLSQDRLTKIDTQVQELTANKLTVQAQLHAAQENLKLLNAKHLSSLTSAAPSVYDMSLMSSLQSLVGQWTQM